MNLDELRRQAEESPTLENLRALRDALRGELRSLDQAAGEGDLDADQQTRWTELETEERATAERVEEAERQARTQQSRARYRSIQIGRQVNAFDGSDVRSLGSREVRDRALSLLDSPEHVGHLSDEQRSTVSRLLRATDKNLNGVHIAQRMLVTENEEYRRAFMRLMTSPVPLLEADEIRAVRQFEEWRAMTIGTDTEGGFGVPVLIDPTIILTAQGHPNDILGLARVETITNDEWKGVSSAGVSWKFRGEGAAATDGAPSVAQPTVPVYRADGWIPYSIEVGMDYPGFAAEMETLIREGYSELLVDSLTTGSGSGAPTGFVTALAANTTDGVKTITATAGAITAADINNTWANLPIRYRNPANRDRQAWFSSTNVNGAIQLLGDDSNIASFTVGLDADGVAIVKGRRALENDYMADLPSGTTTAAHLAVVGDWRNFLVAQRAGMQIELQALVTDTATGAPTGQRAWFAWARVGSDVINDKGFQMLENKTS